MNALVTILRGYYPIVYRIAYLLAGDANSARDVTRKILRQSVRFALKWRDDAEALRWYAHHTLLASRLISPEINSSQLVRLPEWVDSPNSSWYAELMRLPRPQREAFLLHHAAGMDLRQLATAMDCSTQAAANHLVAAATAMKKSGEESLAQWTAVLPDALRRLVPPDEVIQVDVQRQIRRALWPGRIKRWVVMPIVWAGIFVAGFYLWRLWEMVEF